MSSMNAGCSREHLNIGQSGIVLGVDRMHEQTVERWSKAMHYDEHELDKLFGCPMDAKACRKQRRDEVIITLVALISVAMIVGLALACMTL
jgi:hypothetical protein